MLMKLTTIYNLIYRLKCLMYDDVDDDDNDMPLETLSKDLHFIKFFAVVGTMVRDIKQ